MEGFEALQTKKFKNHQLLKTRSKLKEIGFVAEDEEGNKIILSFAKCAFPSEYEKLESLNETDLLNSDLVEKIDSKIRNLSNLENVSVADFSRADQSSNTLISESKILYNSDQLNKINLTCVYPATQKLINKTDKKQILIRETREIYENVTLPYIQNNQHSNQWIVDILEGRAEVDRVLFNDPDPEIGFQLAYCMKWPGTKETLYCNTFVMDSSILSIRSLRAKHLPLLKYMKNKSIQVIQDKYGLGEENLRIYVHYQPSFYWFHLHIVNVNYFPLSMDVERAILLEDIIQNLEMSDTYYQNKTLLFHVDENSELNSKIQDYLDDKNL